MRTDRRLRCGEIKKTNVNSGRAHPIMSSLPDI